MLTNTTGADWGLRARMFTTIGLLAVVYIAFLAFLSSAGVRTGGLIAIAAVMLGAQYFFSDRMALAGMGAKVVSEAEAPELHALVARLADESGIPKPRVAVSRMPILNAFATGRSPRKAVVAVTEPLLEHLTPAELEAVMAHEICHVKHRDVAVMTLASFFSMVAFFLMRSFLFSAMFGGGRRRDEGGSPLAVAFLVAVVVGFVSRLLIAALGRYRELAADRGGAHLTRRPADLASALRKIAGATAHTSPGQREAVSQMSAFFIVPTNLRDLFASHPPLDVRIRQLDELARDMDA